MNDDEFMELVVAAVNFIQTESGREQCAVAPGLRPLKDVPGFDSLNGMEASAALSAQLGVEFGNNPFKDEQTNRALNLAEIAVRSRTVISTYNGGAT